jgi:hypothetical protein
LRAGIVTLLRVDLRLQKDRKGAVEFEIEPKIARIAL